MSAKKMSLLYWISAGAGLGLYASGALAAGTDKRNATLEEVVVSAQKQDEIVQNVPIAITALDESALQKMNFTNLGNLANKVPSVTMSPFVSNSSQMVVFMRGVGLIASGNVSRDPGVGIYLDDVYIGRAQGSTADLADVERIEVLRGPQGTLYGRNTIGGAIKFVTAKPTGEFGLKQAITAGNLGLVRSSTAINLPEFAGISSKFSFLSDRRDGSVHNPGAGPDFGEADKTGYRLSLLGHPSADSTVEYDYDRSTQDGTSAYIQRIESSTYFTPVPFRTPINRHRLDSAIRGSDLPLKDDFAVSGHALTGTWNISDDITLKSISSYRTLTSSRLQDAVEGLGFGTLYAGKVNQKQYSQEFVLNGTSDRVDWISGLYFFRENAHQEQATATCIANCAVYPNDPVNVFRPVTLADLPKAAVADIVNISYAAYGQLTWTPPVLDDQLNIALGARVSRDDRRFRSTNSAGYASGEKSYTSVDPSLTVDYRWNPDLHTYLKASTGHRSGGYSVGTSPTNNPFDPEKLTTYEAGLKSKWWQDRGRFNLALYHSDYDDIQTDFQDSSNIPRVVNAGAATIKGAEVELALIPIDGLQIDLNYSWMTISRGTVINPFTNQPLIGIELPQTPKNKYNLDVQYTFQPSVIGQWSAGVGYSHSDEYYTYGGPKGSDYPVDSYGLVDANITLSSIPLSQDGRGDLSISVWGKNLLNEDYGVYALFGSQIFGDPRTFGITATYKY